MNFNEEDGFNLNDLAKRLANIIRLGQIFAIDYGKAKARVKIGNLETNWLSWITSNSGNNNNWNPVAIDEQVIVLSPCGELNQGVILPSVYRDNIPETNPNIYSINFADGSRIAFDHNLGNLTLDIKGSVNIKVTGNAQIESSNITLQGNIDLGGTGGKAIARIGDKVKIDAGSSAGEWPIISGSSTVKAT